MTVKIIPIAIVAALSLLLTADVAAQILNACSGPATCSNSGGVRTCTVVFSPTLMPGFTSTNTSGAATSCSVSGTGPFTFVANRPTTASPTAGCSFIGPFYAPTKAAANAARIPLGTSTFTSFHCIISEAEGLPVELMEFSVAEPEQNSSP